MMEVGAGKAERPSASPALPPPYRRWRPMGFSVFPSSNQGSGW